MDDTQKLLLYENIEQYVHVGTSEHIKVYQCKINLNTSYENVYYKKTDISTALQQPSTVVWSGNIMIASYSYIGCDIISIQLGKVSHYLLHSY